MNIAIVGGDEYPTRAELGRVRNWRVESMADCEALLSYVESIWWNPEWWFRRASRNRRSRANPYGGKYRLYEISTGGWSGNEDIIDALMRNTMFWAFCWDSSRRGGHYAFKVPVL